jgi:hypothetical protein
MKNAALRLLASTIAVGALALGGAAPALAAKHHRHHHKTNTEDASFNVLSVSAASGQCAGGGSPGAGQSGQPSQAS